MTQEQKPVLLTEVGIRALLDLSIKPDAFRAYLRERGLIAEEPVDPMLIEAREIAARHFSNTGLYPEKVRAGERDEDEAVIIAHAALRRGREIEREAASPLTRERVREMLRAALNLGPQNSISDGAVDRALCALTQEGRHVG